MSVKNLDAGTNNQEGDAIAATPRRPRRRRQPRRQRRRQRRLQWQRKPGAARSSQAQRARSGQERPGAARSRQEQAGAAGNQERVSAARSAQEQPGAARRPPGAARNSQERPRAARGSRERPGAPTSTHTDINVFYFENDIKSTKTHAQIHKAQRPNFIMKYQHFCYYGSECSIHIMTQSMINGKNKSQKKQYSGRQLTKNEVDHDIYIQKSK